MHRCLFACPAVLKLALALVLVVILGGTPASAADQALAVPQAHTSRFNLASQGHLVRLPGVASLELPGGVVEEQAITLSGGDTSRVAPHAGERVVAAVRIDGRAALPRLDATIPEGVVTFEDPHGLGPWTVMVRCRAFTIPLAGYIPRARFEDGRLQAPVPLPTRLSGAVEVFAVDLGQAVEQVMTPVLVEDPLDASPLGDRQVLIYVHGRVGGDLTGDHHAPSKIEDWHGVRQDARYPALLRRFKPYFYLYPTYRSTAQNGADLVRLVGERIGALGPDRVVLLGHSMGGVVVRRAMSVPGFGPRVALAVTMAAPHHGTILTSMAYANGHIGERIGAFFGLVLRIGAAHEPDSPGLRDMAWDNFDGGITPADEDRYGPLVNRELGSFNASWPYGERLACIASDVHNLLFHEDLLGLPDEIIRLGQAAWRSDYGDSDPFIPLVSAEFAYAPVRSRTIFDGMDHGQIIWSTGAVNAIYAYLQGEAFARDDPPASAPPVHPPRSQ